MPRKTQKYKDTLEINEYLFPVSIFIEKRNGCRASIGRKSINIRIPDFLGKKQIYDEVQKLKSWASDKILSNIEKYTIGLSRTYKDGDIIDVGGKNFVLNISFSESISSSARFIGSTINLSIADRYPKATQQNHIKTLLSRCIGEERLPILEAKINKLNKTFFNCRINNIVFKHQKSRWGSCSSIGNINISTRLLFAPDDVLEYVCIHEIAHLVHPNHSAAFWNLVKKVMPDYKMKEKWLKDNDHLCNF